MQKNGTKQTMSCVPSSTLKMRKSEKDYHMKRHTHYTHAYTQIRDGRDLWKSKTSCETLPFGLFGAHIRFLDALPSLNPTRGALSRIYVYECVYACTHANFLWLFLILSVEEGTTGLTQKKFIVFSGTIKVGPICSDFIRGDPYEPHKPPEKVTFSDH